MNKDALSLLADPSGLPLRIDGALLRSNEGVWPMLGGVPVLVSDPARWLAARRDSVLAALAEVGRAGPEERERLDAFAGAVTATAAIRESDDWVRGDEREDEDPLLPESEGAASESLAAWLAANPPSVLHDLLASWCLSGPVLEVGCGAGPLTRRLAKRPLVVLDLSLRAVLRATASTDAQPVVGEAERLPVREGTFGTVVAANVIDLLDDPGAFVHSAARALKVGGRLVLSTPDPALGIRGGTDEALVDLVEGAGLEVIEDRDGVPWVRSHSTRHHEVYVVRAIAAKRPS